MSADRDLGQPERRSDSLVFHPPLQPVALSLDLNHVRVMKEPVEDRHRRGMIVQHLAEVLQRAVAGEDGRTDLVTAHQNLEKVLGRGRRQGPQPEVVNDIFNGDPTFVQQDRRPEVSANGEWLSRYLQQYRYPLSLPATTSQR